MKFLSFAVAALAAVPSVLATVSGLGAPTHELSSRHLKDELELAERGRCTMYDRAVCYRAYRALDENTCGCTSLPLLQLWPRQPWGALFYACCTNTQKIAQCWDNGDNVDAFCNCFRGNGPHYTDPPARCYDWFRIASCHCRGMATDSNCNCVSGNQEVPGGNTQCKDPAALSKCWSKGLAVDRNCQCIDPPPQVGKCKNIIAILKCAKGLYGVNPDCSCTHCNCYDQWRCVKVGGYLTPSCQCVKPSRAFKREDALCPKNKTKCVIDPEWSDSYECLDLESNLESCGGCMSQGEGQDCTAIEGAAAVSCVKGKCVVSQWLDGRGPSA